MRAFPTPRAVLLLTSLLGCSYFKELQDAEDASAGSDDDTSGSSTADDTAGETVDTGGSETAAVCELATDDRCGDQDTLFTCDPATGEVTEYSCAAMCGGNLNFTCLLASNDGQHGCYCVVPGFDGSTCFELETCLRDCVNAASSGCTDTCFSRATTGTIRTYGALVYCAHTDCADMCRDTPELCGSCVESAIITGMGACQVERSLCDNDVPADPW
jgi:hypothetical protein